MIFKILKLFLLAAALLLMSAATTVADVAADQDDNCENWAAMGECDNVRMCAALLFCLSRQVHLCIFICGFCSCLETIP